METYFFISIVLFIFLLMINALAVKHGADGGLQTELCVSISLLWPIVLVALFIEVAFDIDVFEL